jgi:predicted SnoaL-like aldol condensation-catalyzing enzyme
MKKLLFTLITGSFIFFASCSSKKEEGSGGMSEKAKKNMAVNDAIMKMFETGDVSKMSDYIATDGVDHSGPKGDIVGIDSIKAFFVEMSQMMTNMKNDIIRTVADDEYVMCWVKGGGTAKVDLPEWGMKAGESHTGNSVEVSKFKDGKVTDHWSFVDANEMMQMMTPQPPVENKSKTENEKSGKESKNK